MKNWYALDFDDSKLRYAKSLGDVLSPPEYLRSRVVKCMTTPEEYKKYEEAFAGSLVLPASLEKEPEADVKVVWKGDTPGIQVADGKILPPVLLIMKTAGTDTYDDMILRAYGAGVRMFQIVVPFDDLADDPQAAVSGRWMDDQRPAFVLKQLPNGGISIFSGTTLTITSRWTQLLDALGIPAVVDGEYYVSANNCYLNIPLAENQSTTVTLPEKCFIRDV